MTLYYLSYISIEENTRVTSLWHMKDDFNTSYFKYTYFLLRVILSTYNATIRYQR